MIRIAAKAKLSFCMGMPVFVPYRLVRLFCIASLLLANAWARDAGWIKVESPHFTVISATGERPTLAWAEEFSQFVAALQQFIPVDPQRLPPFTIVIFANDRAFDRYRAQGPDGKSLPVDGFFFRNEDWSMAGLAKASGSRAVQRVLFHEGVHWFLSAFSRRNPVWIEEGLAEVFSTFEVDRRSTSWGHPIRTYLEVLDFERPMPLGELMDQSQDFLIHEERETASLVYVQSWAFMHFLLFGKHDIPRTSINEYLRLIKSKPGSEALFQEAFGAAYAEVEEQFRAYLRGGTFFVGKQPLRETPSLKVSRADAFEVELALGRLAIASKRLDRAREHADQSLELRPQDPKSHELLALVLERSGDRNAALHAYIAAATRGSRAFRTYFQLGLGVEQQTPEDKTEAEARTITQFYQKAVTVDPYQLESYHRLLNVSAHLGEINEQDLEILRLGHRIFPAEPELILGLGYLEERAGNFETAAALANSLFKEGDAFAPEFQDRARLFFARWDGQRALGTIEYFVGQQAFDKALAVAERALTDEANSRRAELVQRRKELASDLMIKRMRSARASGNWTGLRDLATQVLAGDFTVDARSLASTELAIFNQRPIQPQPGKFTFDSELAEPASLSIKE